MSDIEGRPGGAAGLRVLLGEEHEPSATADDGKLQKMKRTRALVVPAKC